MSVTDISLVKQVEKPAIYLSLVVLEAGLPEILKMPMFFDYDIQKHGFFLQLNIMLFEALSAETTCLS